MERITQLQTLTAPHRPPAELDATELRVRAEMQALGDHVIPYVNGIPTEVVQEFAAMYEIRVRFNLALMSAPGYTGLEILDAERRFNNFIEFVKNNPQHLETIKNIFASPDDSDGDFKYATYGVYCETLSEKLDVPYATKLFGYDLKGALECCYIAFQDVTGQI